MSTNEDKMAALLGAAATLGADLKAQQAAHDADAVKRREAKDLATARVNDDQFLASGFNSLRYIGLAKMGSALAAQFNGPDSQARQDAARGMADAFMASFTGATVKTLSGGKQAGYGRVIALGNDAERCRRALQQRLDYWRGIKDSAPDGESAKDAALRKALAGRYLTVCGSTPNPDGSLPADKDGKTIMPKFNGRPAMMVDGVAIPAGRGTDRDAQLAAFAILFRDHGEVVLRPAVVDAFLDNGGKYVPADNETLSDVANAALTAVDKMLANGGTGSGDEAFLRLAATMFGRIAREGLKGSVMAAPVDSADTDESAAEGSEGVSEGETAQDVLDAAEGASQPPVEGEGVTFGGTTKPARARRSKKEAQQAA